MQTIRQIQQQWANGYAAPLIEALKPKQEAFDADKLSKMNWVADAIADVGPVAHLGDFMFAMHGTMHGKPNVTGRCDPQDYKALRDQFTSSMLGMVFASANNNAFDGPLDYWMIDESYLERGSKDGQGSKEVRDADEGEWSAVRYQVRKHMGLYVGQVIVPALVVERRHILGELGELGEVTERNFIVRTVERSAVYLDALPPQDNPIITAEGITADFRGMYPSSEYGAAIEHVAEALELINAAQKERIAAILQNARDES